MEIIYKVIKIRYDESPVKFIWETSMKKILSIVFCALSMTTFAVGAATAPAKIAPTPVTGSCNFAYAHCLGTTGKGPATHIVQNRCYKEQKTATNAYGRTATYFTGKLICF